MPRRETVNTLKPEETQMCFPLQSTCNGGQRDGPTQGQNGGVQRGEAPSLSPECVEEPRVLEHKRTGRALEPEKDHTRSISLLEQKRKVVSSSIDVPQAR